MNRLNTQFALFAIFYGLVIGNLGLSLVYASLNVWIGILMIFLSKMDDLHQSSSCSLVTSSSRSSSSKSIVDDDSSLNKCNNNELEMVKDLRLNSPKRPNLYRLVKSLYSEENSQEINNDLDECPSIDGYLEMLPNGKNQKNSMLLTWKKRYFSLKMGCLKIFENENSALLNSYNIMGGYLEFEENNVICLDDSRGNYLVLRVPINNFDEWKYALDKNILDRPEITWIRPQVGFTQSKKVLLIDIGTCSIRAGVYSEEPKLPQIFIPNVCLKDINGEYKVGLQAFESMEDKKPNQLIFPLKSRNSLHQFGIDFDCLKAIFNYIIRELSLETNDYQVLLITPHKYSDKIHVEFIRLLIEQLNFSAITIINQSLLVLYSYNVSSGIIVNLSEKIEITPICNGIVFQNGVSNLAYGASTMSEYLNSFVSRSHYNFINDAEQYLVRLIKEKSCYIAYDLKEELKKPIDEIRREISLENFGFSSSNELDMTRFESSEGLLNPEIWGMDGQGIHKLIVKAIQSCSMDLRRGMAKSIYLSGGMSRLVGLRERLEKEVKNLLPTSMNVKVNLSPYSYHSAFLGAYKFISQPEYESLKITCKEWSLDNVNSLRKWRVM